MPAVTVECHITAADLIRSLRADVREGLTRWPRTLPPRWFYDARGSELFERITRLEEYYLTRAERAILEARAAEIASACGADTLLELGSGSSEKTRLLLDALKGMGALRCYVPVDVSEAALTGAAERIAADYPSLRVRAVVADFEGQLDVLPAGGRRLVALLGSTIGNLPPAARMAFLTQVRSSMAAGDALLLGADLVKPTARLLAAYDDAEGVTAEFNRNVLHVINRELGADFVPERFTHVAAWSAGNEWMEMRLRSHRDQTVRIPSVGMEVAFAAGEEMRTEISAKFRRERLEAELDVAGLALRHWWTDPAGDFALCLATPVDPGQGG